MIGWWCTVSPDDAAALLEATELEEFDELEGEWSLAWLWLLLLLVVMEEDVVVVVDRYLNLLAG